LRILNLALQILLLFLLVFNSFADESIKKVTDELDNNFLFKGKPIHPGCIKEFEVGLADSPPPIIKSIDIESCMSSNDFYMDLKKNDMGYISYESKNEYDDNIYFGYKYIGKTSTGIHVVDTSSSGGGTMVSTTVFLLDFNQGKYTKFNKVNNPDDEKRIYLECVGQIVRGDRDTGSVVLNGDKLILGKSQYREKPEVYNLKLVKRN